MPKNINNTFEVNNTFEDNKNQHDFHAVSEAFNQEEAVVDTTLKYDEQAVGFTKWNNALKDALLRAPITFRQYKIFDAIHRKTIGWSKEFDRITDMQLSEMTGIHRTHINRAKSELIKLNMLSMFGDKVGVNKNFQEWTFSSNVEKLPSNKKTKNLHHVAESVTKNTVHPKTDKNKKFTYKSNDCSKYVAKPATECQNSHSVAKSATTKCSQISYTQKKEKQNKNNNIYIQNISLDLSCFKQQPSQAVWSDYLLHRKVKKAPLTQTALNRLASKINEANEKGYDTNDVLADCMLRNWQGFDVSWLENKRTVTSTSIQSKQELEAAWNDTSIVDDFINSPAFAEALRVGERRRSMCSY